MNAANRLADGHQPLRAAITELSLRARIPVADSTSTVEHKPALRHGLTPQEERVLRLLATGLTNAEIGIALFISPKTASVHVSNLLRKLEVANRTEAATWAARNGFLPED
jgi:DNA-binding NarL/FixJ family response regulator